MYLKLKGSGCPIASDQKLTQMPLETKLQTCNYCNRLILKLNKTIISALEFCKQFSISILKKSMVDKQNNLDLVPDLHRVQIQAITRASGPLSWMGPTYPKTRRFQWSMGFPFSFSSQCSAALVDPTQQERGRGASNGGIFFSSFLGFWHPRWTPLPVGPTHQRIRTPFGSILNGFLWQCFTAQQILPIGRSELLGLIKFYCSFGPLIPW